MNPKTRRRFTADFKTQAVQLLETGKPVAQLAEELSISSDLLYSWRRSAQGAQVGGAGARAAAERAEAGELRRENSLLRQENDILKKAAVILGTKLLPSSAK
jgi:transposase